VIVNGHGEHLFRRLLANHVLVENALDFVRLGQLLTTALGALVEFLANDVVAQLYAFVTNEYRWAGNQLADFMLTLTAERAVKELTVVRFAARIIAHSPVLLPPSTAFCGLIALVQSVCKAPMPTFATNARRAYLVELSGLTARLGPFIQYSVN
jgi:hypothetical protein